MYKMENRRFSKQSRREARTTPWEWLYSFLRVDF